MQSVYLLLTTYSVNKSYELLWQKKYGRQHSFGMGPLAEEAFMKANEVPVMLPILIQFISKPPFTQKSELLFFWFNLELDLFFIYL